VPVELYENDGSVGAALGAGIGAKIFEDEKAAFKKYEAAEVNRAKWKA
jgi:xylulokinase